MSALKLTNALLVFKTGDNHNYYELATYRQISETSYEETERKPVTPDLIRKLNLFTIPEKEKFSLKGKLNRNVIKMDVSNQGYEITWEPKNYSSTVIVVGEHFPVKWPKIIFKANVDKLWVYVLKQGKLMSNPFPNVSGGSQMCFGNIDKKNSFSDFEDFFETFESYFFNTSFTDSNEFLESCINLKPNLTLLKNHASD